jgi:hypothetical protein
LPGASGKRHDICLVDEVQKMHLPCFSTGITRPAARRGF